MRPVLIIFPITLQKLLKTLLDFVEDSDGYAARCDTIVGNARANLYDRYPAMLQCLDLYNAAVRRREQRDKDSKLEEKR
jgi:hypothetical protein